MRIKLGDWEKHYPDGISLSSYQRVGRLIRRYGPLVTIELRQFTHDELSRAMDKLERDKK